MIGATVERAEAEQMSREGRETWLPPVLAGARPCATTSSTRWTRRERARIAEYGPILLRGCQVQRPVPKRGKRAFREP